MVAVRGRGWVLAPSLIAYVDEANRLFPTRDVTTDGSIGDQAHASRESDHNPFDGFVHAVDLDEDIAPGVDLDALWDHLIAEIKADIAAGRKPRIRYLIYEDRIVKGYRDSAGHRPGVPYDYSGPNQHLGHLHLSVDRTPAARNDMRPWWPQEDSDMPLNAADLKKIGTLLDDKLKQQHKDITGWVQAELGTNDGTPRKDSLLGRLKILLGK